MLYRLQWPHREYRQRFSRFTFWKKNSPGISSKGRRSSTGKERGEEARREMKREERVEDLRPGGRRGEEARPKREGREPEQAFFVLFPSFPLCLFFPVSQFHCLENRPFSLTGNDLCYPIICMNQEKLNPLPSLFFLVVFSSLLYPDFSVNKVASLLALTVSSLFFRAILSL